MRGHVALNGKPGEAEIVARIVDECVRTDEQGKPCGVWHALSTVTGNPCWCAHCNPNSAAVFKGGR